MRKTWVIVFLVLTGGALGMELVAGLDSSPSTVPWTELISGYIPQPITMTAITVLATWLPVHFAHHYVGKAPEQKYSKTLSSAVTAGLIALGAALTDDTVTRAEMSAILLAILGAFGVYATPNASALPDAVRHLRARQDKQQPPRVPPGAVPPRM
jgi:hypothetical protein